MVRKAFALAVVGMVALSGPAFAADAQTPASRAAVKADAIQRASLLQDGDQATGDADLWVWLGFGLVTIGVTANAWDNDKNPSSP